MGNTSVGQAEGLTMSLGMACCWMRVGDVKFISARAEAHSGLEAELMQAWSMAQRHIRSCGEARTNLHKIK